MHTIELTFKLEISEESLAEMRDEQTVGEFGAEQAMILLHDANPRVHLVHVQDNN